jgi:hypothetical protein
VVEQTQEVDMGSAPDLDLIGDVSIFDTFLPDSQDGFC